MSCPECGYHEADGRCLNENCGWAAPAGTPPPPAGPIPDPPHVEPARENNPEGHDLRAAAERWMEDNPVAYGLFVRFALEAHASGSRFGVGLLCERVRWEALVTTRSDDGYKVNNNHRAYIARRLVADHPQLNGFIRFRRTAY